MEYKEKVIEPGKQGISRMILEKLRLSAEDKVDKLSYANEELFYYVIGGYGLLEFGEYGYALEPQLSVYIPPKTLHSFQSTGESELILLRYAAKENN